MHRFSLLALAFSLLCSAPAIAQQLNPGEYLITDEKGNSPAAPKESGVDIEPGQNGDLTGKVWVRDPGTGLKSYYAPEFLTFTPNGEGCYTWVNKRGATGVVKWIWPIGWVSVVSTGPHKGKIRILHYNGQL